MGNLFGVRRRAPQVTAQDRAILQLKQQRDKITIYQKKIETQLFKDKDLALILFQNNRKERALVVLRRNKYLQENVVKLDKQLETLEGLVSDIEFAQIEVSVVEGLKVGTEALKSLNNLINIEDVQQIMEDNEEAALKQKEISDLLQKTPERYDEEELLDELKKLAGVEEKEEEEEKAKTEVEQPIEVKTPEVDLLDEALDAIKTPTDEPIVVEPTAISEESGGSKDKSGRVREPVLS